MLLNANLMRIEPTSLIREQLVTLARKTTSKHTLAKVRHYLIAWGEYETLQRVDDVICIRFASYIQTYFDSVSRFWRHLENYTPKSWKRSA